MSHRFPKNQIAICFEKHFNHFGFKKTSVDEVAKELKISKKTIYQFFSTKEEILYYIVNKIAYDYCQYMEDKLAGILAYHEKLSILLKMILSESRKWLTLKDNFEYKFKSDLVALALPDAYNELLRKILAQGVEAGEFSEIPLEITIRFIDGLITESMKILNASAKINVADDLVQAVFKLLQ